LDFSVLPGDAAASDTATLPYMAPERIDGRMSPACDLFSLGTIFYEALARRHPRAGCRTVSELIRKRPVALADAAPIPEEFAVAARVVDRMIAADPKGRFAAATSVLSALDGGTAEIAPEPAGEDFYPLAMIGAEAALSALESILESVPRKSAALAVHGPSGAGRTRFVREAAFEAAVRGLAVSEFTDLHRSGVETRGRVLNALRSLPAKGALLLLEWDDQDLPPDARRFFDALLSEGLAHGVALGPLSREDSVRLVEGFLEPEAARGLVDAVFVGTGGIPGRILALLKRLSVEGKVRDRSLLPGWKEALEEGLPREADPAEPAALSRFLREKVNRLNAAGRYEEALKVAERWFSLEADDEPLPLRTAKYWFITGWGHHNLGHSEQAEKRLRRCLKESEGHQDDPEIAGLLARSRSLLGLAALARGDGASAVREFEAALALQPENDPARAETFRNLARALAAMKDFGEAHRLLERAKALYRDAGREDGLFWTLLQEGNLALEQKDFGKAAAAYETARELAERSGSDLRLAIVWNNMGLLERERGRFGEALGFLHKARDVLRFLGNANDVEQNARELAVAEASVGRWARAESFLKQLPEPMAREAEAALRDLREGRTAETAESLKELFQSLPPELQVTFVDRGDWRRHFSKKSEIREVPMSPTPPLHEVLSSLTKLNEELLAADDIPGVLERLMDAAMALSRAESGFLVLRSEAPDGPIPGFEVAVARNVAKQDLQTDTYTFSLSAVRRALQTGEAVVTDNAVLDPLFREARSVHLRQLKSLVALPVKGPEEILGVFYLDHRFEEGLFEGGLLEVLKTFASVAALALQKGRMIEALSRNNRELTEQVRSQTRELSRSRMILKNEYSEIVGRSTKMVDVLSLVDRVTDAKVPVWIFGESGTGKEAVARALHFNGPRAKKPFVTENCGALPESLLESELFGHKKGAFTHAVADKKGILAYANGGTIFLDEIADMSLALQAKLLRFLQEGEIRPIGSTEVVKVDVRVVSASNKDLAALVAEGKFREDLFYRLNGVTVTLPPLRDRMEDLPLLVEHFLKKHGARLDADALRIFMGYAWPGNIRELQNTLETAVLFAEKGVISAASLHFKPALTAGGVSARPRLSAVLSKAVSEARAGEKSDPVLEETLRTIRDNAYHKGHAAEALGITRRALYARLQKHGIRTDAKSLKAEVDRRLGSA
jgi:transcriptional regulator with GAF, ATPase, and Fis domain/Tfp pilus assembly protein PilF